MEKHKTTEGGGEFQPGIGSLSLNVVVREGLPKKVAYQRKSELGNGGKLRGYLGKSSPNTGNSKYKRQGRCIKKISKKSVG